MSEKLYPFHSRHNFKNEYFYYYLPYNVKRKDIGEKITKYQGVNIDIFFNFKIQLISFCLKENINIIIQNEKDLESKSFQKEILICGYVKFYKNEKLSKILECKNKKIQKPVSFNCFLLEGKKI